MDWSILVCDVFLMSSKLMKYSEAKIGGFKN
ncbi:MAG: hypothetical protein RL629_1431, partial [Pseudomonadota bacterium]